VLKISRYGPVTRIDVARSLPFFEGYWTTAYLVDGMLIDTGCAHTAPELVRALEEQPPTRVVNTHAHEDHIGANGLLQSWLTGLEILAHELALPVLADPRGQQPLHPYRRVFWGWPEPSQGIPMAEGEVIETAEYRFHVMHTPGHSPDHCCLFEPDQGWLFSGDLFVGGRERALRVDYDIWGILSSLKRLVDLPLRTLFPGAAGVRQNPAEVLHAKIAHLEKMGDRVLELRKRGWGVSRIVRAVCGKPLFLELLTLGHFSRRGLVQSYLGRNQT
jgi:glyoxylase-like metal-dependent hydrolase (beta-lactamase superfamily II)